MEQTGKSLIEARITIYFLFGNVWIQLSFEFFIVRVFVILIKFGFFITFNPLSANITKWSNTLKQFVGKFLGK